MKAYSEDLRWKIVFALQRGMPKVQVASLFDVSLSSVKRYARMAYQGRSLAPKKRPGRPAKIDEGVSRLLKANTRERPTATISDRRRFLEHLTGKQLSDSNVWRLLKHLEYSRKKERERNRKRRMAEDIMACDGCREA